LRVILEGEKTNPKESKEAIFFIYGKIIIIFIKQKSISILLLRKFSHKLNPNANEILYFCVCNFSKDHYNKN